MFSAFRNERGRWTMNDTESESKFDKLVSVTSLSQHRPAFSSTRIRQRRFETALLFAGSLSARPLVNTPVPLQYTTDAAAVCLLHPGACRPLVECPHPRAIGTVRQKPAVVLVKLEQDHNNPAR